MTPHQTLAATVRLFAIWLFLYYISTTVGTYLQLRKYSPDDTLLPLFIGFGSTLAVCTLLWCFSTVIAKKILPNTSSSENNQTKLFDGWFSVGCSLIGVWVLAKALPALVSYITSDYIGQKFYPESYVQNPDWLLMLYFNIFQFLFGLWLFLGGKGLKKILLWARYA
ncbi:MAG: hypothetical protein Q7T42_07230 [Methylotenera sp.]|uniref:hypothetical protein n=1 Tax=Methylotenera sp. TaxID=2051956 RepID=UPI00271A0EDA|nr:hypothetical protein [Methylotenera sp.]MDO9393747.1 hypothetical protein [Methylotenera sp.]